LVSEKSTGPALRTRGRPDRLDPPSETCFILGVVEAPASADALERPHVVWWILVIGGLALLGLQSFSAPFYAWWVMRVNALPGQLVMRWIFFACIPIHVYEALYVRRTAEKVGIHRSKTAWIVQTFLLGYPSTHLFRKHARVARSQAPQS
jgi:hypothetical protein